MIELCALGVCAMVPACGVAQSTAPAERRAYRLPRYEEDWSFLRDSHRGSDWLDPIKFVPLGRNTNAYASFGGQLRETYERFHRKAEGINPAKSKPLSLEFAAAVGKPSPSVQISHP
jgi:hypothetical protein